MQNLDLLAGIFQSCKSPGICYAYNHKHNRYMKDQNHRVAKIRRTVMNDVFISYSRRDKVFTQKLFEALKGANLEAGADWDSSLPRTGRGDQEGSSRPNWYCSCSVRNGSSPTNAARNWCTPFKWGSGSFPSCTCPLTPKVCHPNWRRSTGSTCVTAMTLTKRFRRSAEPWIPIWNG